MLWPGAPPTLAPMTTASGPMASGSGRVAKGCTVQSVAKSTPISRVAPVVEQQLRSRDWVKNWVVERAMPSMPAMRSAVSAGK